MRGSKPGERRGGRAKGTPNKATVQALETFEQAQKRAVAGLTREEIGAMTPLDTMLFVMHEMTAIGELTIAATVAKAAAPFIHPTLAQVESFVKTDQTIKIVQDKPITEEQWIADFGNDNSLVAPARTAGGVG